jgi:hypothetical protein
MKASSGNRPGPPRLFCQGKLTTLDLSPSHDGNFGAYAVLIQEPEKDAKGPGPSAAECEREIPSA